MDKLKEQLAPVLKHFFWILCGVILIVSFIGWYQATSGIKTEQERLKADIDSKAKAVSAIPPNHPNDNTNKGMEELNRKFGEDVGKAWARLVANQENVLVWSTAVFDPTFIEEVRPLRPPELKVTGDYRHEISPDNKTFARNHFEKVLPKLADTIGSKWSAKAQPAGMGGGMPGFGGEAPGGEGGIAPGVGGLAGLMPGLGGQPAEVDDAIVFWNPGNQAELLGNHFGFISSDSLPNTMQVLYAQEDFWVLQNIMNIIKATNEANGKIKHRHEAAIKYIDYVRIGRSAWGVAGKVAAVGSRGGTESGGGDNIMPGMPGMPGGAGGEPGGAAMPGGQGGGEAPPGGGAGGGMPMPGVAAGGEGVPGGGGAASTNPTDNRYVDRDYKPVLAKRLVAAMKGTPEKPEDLLLAVAKRAPVRMRFKMDWRKLPTLLAECGNSSLPVEVRQVRINRQAASSSGGGEMGGGMQGPMGGGMMPGMMGGAMPGMAPGGPGAEPGEGAAAGAFGGAFGGQGVVNPNRAQITDSSVDPNEITVEIYGIVYIYNPVNRVVLGLPDEAPKPPTVAPVPTPASTSPPAVPAPNAGAATTPAAAVLPGVN